MIFGNSDPAFFAIFVSAELGQGRDATRLLERLRLEFWDRWLRPSLAALVGRPRPRRWSRPLARPLPGFRPEDCGVLPRTEVRGSLPPQKNSANPLPGQRSLRERKLPKGPTAGDACGGIEVSASYPVNRANPPASLAARLRQLRRPRRDRTPDRKTIFAVTERALPSPPLFVRRGEGTTATATPPLSSPNSGEDDHLVVLCRALSILSYGPLGRQSVR